MKVSWKNCTLNIIRKFFHTEIVGFHKYTRKKCCKKLQALFHF